MKVVTLLFFICLILSIARTSTTKSGKNKGKSSDDKDKKKSSDKKDEKDSNVEGKEKDKEDQHKDKDKDKNDDDKANEKGEEPLKCQNDVLRSYLIRGRLTAKKDKMVTCPRIQNNCCTKVDQQRIYHMVNDILPPRFLEYQSKMKMAMVKLKQLHRNVLLNKPFFKGKPAKRSFCGTEARKIYNYPFIMFYNRVVEDLDDVRIDMDRYYRTFFCNICDGDNQAFMDIKHKKLTVDGEFCQEFLRDHKEIVELLNIELVNYLIILQNVVDCTHYSKSFNLKFFDERRQKFTKEVGECINHLESSKFLKNCQTTCENINISKINVLFEGDFDFLMDAINIFEDFFQRKEDGKYISMRLRLFFKKFVIPRKLSKKKKERFLKELRTKEAKIAQRRLQKINEKLSRSRESALRGEYVKNVDNDNKKVKRQRNINRPIERNLIEVLPNKKIQKNKEIEKHTVGEGRLLSTASKSTNKTDASGQKKPVDKEQQKYLNKFKNKNKKKKAKLVYNKELFHFYSELKVIVPQKKEYIFKVKPRPIDIEKFQKIVTMHDGINTGKHLSSMKFSLPPAIFYKQLFSFRKPDPADPALMFFLSEFTEKMLKDLKEDLSTKFKLELPKKKKKKKPRKRMLSSLEDPLELNNEKNMEEEIPKNFKLEIPDN